jgi:SAM-dependent methyltransferase
LFALGPFDRARRILDIGAGTGEVGIELSAAGEGYLGIDESPEMLAIFRNRAGVAGLRPELLVADARRPWPVAPGSVGLVFGSRSLHWLEPEHVAEQARAAASPRGATLVVGRVVRDPESPAERTRRAMRALLRREGYEGRSGSQSSGRLVAACVARGAVALPPEVAATWTVRRSARASIDAWRSKPGLAGVRVPDEVKAKVLAELEGFTAEATGNIDATVESSEKFVLEGVSLVPRTS